MLKQFAANTVTQKRYPAQSLTALGIKLTNNQQAFIGLAVHNYPYLYGPILTGQAMHQYSAYVCAKALCYHLARGVYPKYYAHYARLCLVKVCKYKPRYPNLYSH